jgi:lysozyme family protein
VAITDGLSQLFDAARRYRRVAEKCAIQWFWPGLIKLVEVLI